MCGIVGFMASEGVAPPLDRACAALEHRGPDDAGTWIGAQGRVAFGHRRLSILDVSAEGHQPFVKGGLVLTYNGEIYNFRELRRELEGLGHTFRSQCDTEVVLEAYRAFGMAFVSRLRGMFALALWDEREQRLVLARDRLGIKPLFVYRDARCLAFASELKALEHIAGLRLTAEETAAYDFLTYLYVPAPKTIYANVQKLLPAHRLSVELERDHFSVKVDRYWEVDFAKGDGPRGAEAAEAVRAAVRDAVSSQLVADVPVGCLLSGGLDSSAVATFAAQNTAQPLRTFSIGFDVERHSETEFARLVARHIGAEHTERIVNVAQARAHLPRLAALYDEPFGDLSAIPTFEVCRVAREAVTVALSGDGGDEVFGGYTSYTRQRRRARWFSWVPALVQAAVPSRLARSVLMRLRGGPTLVDGLRAPLERHVVIQGGFTRAEKEHALPAAVARRFAGYDDLWAFRAHDRPDLDPLTRFQIIDLMTYLPDDILVKVDRASMACSLEVRPPLLDDALVELVASIPSSTRNPRGELKALFKRALREHLPAAILRREKKGFGVPLAAWHAELGIGSAARAVGGLGNGAAVTELGSVLLATLRGWALDHQGPVWAQELGA
jgi:asparagine synthase (glutamine-hydrolysing)